MEDEGMGGRKLTVQNRLCDSLSHFYFLSLIPRNCEWCGIEKQKELHMLSVCGLFRYVCANLQL